MRQEDKAIPTRAPVVSISSVRSPAQGERDGPLWLVGLRGMKFLVEGRRKQQGEKRGVVGRALHADSSPGSSEELLSSSPG